mgnify:CR=1 FL=1
MKPTVEQIAAMFGAPVESVRNQYRRNAAQLRESARRAGSRSYRGYTAREYSRFAAHAETQAN